MYWLLIILRCLMGLFENGECFAPLRLAFAPVSGKGVSLTTVRRYSRVPGVGRINVGLVQKSFGGLSYPNVFGDVSCWGAKEKDYYLPRTQSAFLPNPNVWQKLRLWPCPVRSDFSPFAGLL